MPRPRFSYLFDCHLSPQIYIAKGSNTRFPLHSLNLSRSYLRKLHDVRSYIWHQFLNSEKEYMKARRKQKTILITINRSSGIPIPNNYMRTYGKAQRHEICRSAKI